MVLPTQQPKIIPMQVGIAIPHVVSKKTLVLEVLTG
jgi:hypothetical protein